MFDTKFRLSCGESNLYNNLSKFRNIYCTKIIRIGSLLGPSFSSFGPINERENLCTQSECGKILTRKSTNTDTFQVVIMSNDVGLFFRASFNSPEKCHDGFITVPVRPS